MKRMLRRKWLPGMLLLSVLVMMLSATSVTAQSDGPPPLPLIYQGEAFLDGEHVAVGSLTARVGDWVSDSVPVVDGIFKCGAPCLLVGPPTAKYIGLRVTFHLEGSEFPANFQFDFPALDAPRSDTVQLFFETDPSDNIPWLLVGLGASFLTAGGGLGYFLIRRRQ